MAIATPLLAGSANVTIDGVPFMLQGDLLWSPSTVTRESLTGMDTVHGYKETPKVCYMEFTLRDSDAIVVAAFNAMTNSTVVAQLANRKTVIGRNMWSVEHQEVNSVEATVKVRLEGPFVEEA